MKKARLKTTQEEKKVEEFKSYSVGKFFVFLSLILVMLGGFYLLTDKVFKPKAEEKVKEEQIEQPNERANNNINYSDIKDIKEKEYYVLFYTEKDESNSTYDMYINSLKANNMGYKFYYVNLDKEDNKSLVDKKSSLKDINKLKVKGSTLVHIKDGKITESFEGDKDIVKHLAAIFNIKIEDSSTTKKEETKKETTKTENNKK